MCSADDAVSRAIVHRDSVSVDHMAVGEDNLAEEALQLVRSCRLHDGRLGPCQHSPGLVEVKQQCAQAVAIFFGRSVIDLQPALGSPDRCSTGSNASAVPIALAAAG